MRRVYMAPILVTAGVVSYGAIGAAGFATGLTACATWVASSQSETFESRFDADEAVAPRMAGPAIRVDWPRVSEGPRSAALRYGVVELLPAGLTQSAIGQSALLRATLEAATDAAIEPP